MPVDFYNAFQQGREVGRRNAAYNALRTHYGDIAGDPEAASQLQQYEQRQALFPLQTEAARLSNAESEAELPYAAAVKQAAIQAAQELANQRAVNTGLAPTNAEALNAQRRANAALTEERAGAYPTLTQAQIGALDASAQQRSAAANLADVNANLAPGLAESLRAYREQQAATAKTAAERGVQARYQVVQGPDGQIYRVPVTQVGAPERVTLDGQPVQGYQAPLAGRRADQADERLKLQAPEGQRATAAAKAVGKVEGERAASDLPLSKTQLAQAKTSLEAAEQSFKLNESEIDRALKDANWTNTGLASLTSIIPGTPAADFEARLNGIGSRVILDTLQELKRMAANGSTGFGQLVTREEEIMQARYNDFRSATSGRAKREALQTLKDQTRLTFDRAKRQFNDDLEARGQSAAVQPSTPSNLPSGWTYIGPKK